MTLGRLLLANDLEYLPKSSSFLYSHGHDADQTILGLIDLGEEE